MKRIVFAAAAMVTLAGCGQLQSTAVRTDGGGTMVIPMVAQIDPDARRGLQPDRARVNCAKEKCVALTFDDGPMKDTERLLKMLQSHNAKATFFVVGAMVKEDPGVLRMEAEAGHELANHSWNHSNLGQMSAEGIRSQLKRTQDIIHETTGATSVLLRPPYGSTNGRVASVAKSMGLPQIMWAVDPLDWRDKSAGTVEKRVLSGTKPGHVVLMHDIHPSTVNAVPRILSGLAGKGFKFVTVTELFQGTKIKPGIQYRERKVSKAR